MHKTYLDAMNRKAHRYALLKGAKENQDAINWQYTKNNWTALKAGDTGDTMLVTVCIEVPKSRYLELKQQYEHTQKMRAAKDKTKHD